ncbi:hypothetical protein AC579_3938 [Pseudocercospora musae]|uniref:Uncharacterized protein n=1 Tax=Pseudocercospora musae TaxID=113226 RepID=A0A139IKA5_9PEZI|nr:hypothetical protein AC579_3938 [Pseudocercospora musae]
MLLSNFFFVTMVSLAVAKPMEKSPDAAGKAASILGAVLMPRYSCGGKCGNSGDCSATAPQPIMASGVVVIPSTGGSLSFCGLSTITSFLYSPDCHLRHAYHSLFDAPPEAQYG